ncbi:MAG: hypothetical protein J6F30_02245 [Cellulosilyticum sp.]|nr:hypothetical protein [Cellulosilyticum sp.]
MLFIGSDRRDYQYDRIIMYYREGLNQMVKYILDDKGYGSLGYIGGYYETEHLIIGKTRHLELINALKQHDAYNEARFSV